MIRAALVACLLATPLGAQVSEQSFTAYCAPFQNMRHVLKHQYFEAPLIIGQMPDGTYTVVTGNTETGTYTVIHVIGEVACLLMSGNALDVKSITVEREGDPT